MARGRKPSLERGSIIIISAPSGAGKSTLVERLVASVPYLVSSISFTTRPRRPGERDGRDYFFVTKREFERRASGGEFVEWAEIVGHLYGTSWKQLRKAAEEGKDILLNIDVQGHRQVRKRLPEAVGVFVLPPSFKELERRLRARRLDSPRVIRKRLARARKEITHWPEYEYLVVNDKLDRATQQLQAVVQAVRLRRQTQEQRARQICKTFGG